MNPSHWFHTGGALIDPQRIGCTGFIVRWGLLALSGLIVLIVFWALT